MSPRAQVSLALLCLIALAVTERFWGPLMPDYWRGIIAGWLSGWMLRGIVARRSMASMRNVYLELCMQEWPGDVPKCACQLEAGDSPCPMHGEDEE